MKLRILVVDDDEDLLFIAEQLLRVQEEELELVRATTAQAAVQFLDEGNLDAVICDFHLGPDQMNGLEILEWVRDEGIDIPFIIFTGHSREEIAIKALNLGADYYIEKSDDLEGLFTEIGYHIKKVVRNKRTEEALHDSEQRLRTLVQSLNDLIFVVDSENRFSQYHSISREELFEPPEKFIGKHISEIFPPSIAGTYIKLVQEVRASGERQSFDYELKTNGERRWYTADLDLHEDKESIVVTVAEISKRKQAELDLRNAERAWRNTFDSIPDIVTVLNNEFEIIKANKTMSDFLGIPSEELIGKKCYELMHRSSEPFSGCPHLETIKTGIPATAKITDPCMGKPFLVTTSPIQDDQGEQVGVVHIAKDISESLEAEKTVKESESQFRAIFNDAGIGIALVMNGHIREANSALLNLLGYDANEIKGLTISDITHPDDRGMDQAALQDLVASDKENYKLEKRYIRKDGEIVWGKTTVSLIRDLDGTQDYVIGMVEDLTETKVAQSALKKSESRLRANFEQAGIGMALVLMDGEIVEANVALQEFLGYDIEELLEMNTSHFTHPEDIEKDSIALQNMLEAEETRYQIEKRYIRKDGEIVLGRLTVSLIRDANGTPQYTIGMVEDITERKKTEILLNAERDRAKTYLNLAGTMILATNTNLDITMINDTGCTILGLAEEEILGKNWIETFIPEQEQERIRNYMLGIMSGQVEPSKTDEGPVIEVSGNVRWIQWSDVVVRGYEGQVVGILSAGPDITEKKIAEEEHLASEAKFRLIFDHAPIGASHAGIEGELIRVNKALENMLGYTIEELTLKKVESITHPDDWKVESKLNQELFNGTRDTYTIEKRFFHKNEQIVWGRLNVSIKRDVEGKPEFVIGMVEDITEQIGMRRKLQESEARFRAMFEHSAVGVARVKMSGEILEANKKTEEMLGYSNGQLVGINVFDITIPDDLETEKLLSRELIEGKRDSYNMIKCYICKDGGRIWGRLTVSIVRDSSGNPEFTIGVIEDITTQRQAEEDLRTSEVRFRSVFEDARIGMTIVSRDDHIIDVNSAYQELVGYTIDELRNITIADITHPDDVLIDAQLFEEVLQGKRSSYQMEKRYIREDGDIIWVHLTVTVVKDEHDEITFIVGMAEDITARKEAESSLSESEYKYRTLLENVQSGIQITQEGIIVFSNEILAEMLGYTIDEIVGSPFLNLIAPEDQEWIIARYRKRLAGEEVLSEYDVRVLHKNGSLKQVRLKIANFEFEGKLSTIATITDVTERRKAEERLRESEEQFRTFVEDGSHGYLVLQGSPPRIVYTNPALLRILSFSEEEFQTMSYRDVLGLLEEDEREAGRNRISAALESGEAPELDYEFKVIGGDGNEVWLSTSPRLITLNNEPAYQILVVDITERKQNQEALERSEERYRLLFENLSDGLFITDSEGIITMCSPQGARLFGKTPDETIGTHFSESMHPDDRERLINEFQRGFENKETQIQGHEVRGIRHDGSEFYYHITNTLLMENDEPIGYQSLIRDITDLKQIEANLRVSELRYKQIIESTPMGMHIYELNANDELVFQGANPAADKLLGVENSQFIGKTIEQAFPPLANTEIPQRYKEVALNGRMWSSEQINYDDDKISGAFEVHAYQTIPRRMVTSFLDITERKVAEQAIANSRENFQTVFETIDDLVFIVGLDTKIITTNHSVRDLLGYSEEELHGLDVLIVHPPDRREEAANILKEMIKGETTVCPVPLMAKDGTIIPVETRITLGRWSGEDVLVGVSRDITESINSEILLKKTTHDLGERMKELTCLYQTTSVLRDPDISTSDAIQAIVKLIPPAWQYPEVTCAKIKINGEDYSTSNFKQSKWKQTADIKVFKEKIGAIQVYYTEERPDNFEGPFLKEERSLIDTLAKHVCEYIERRISEKALQENEDRYRSLVENIPVVSWTSNSKGETTFISQNVEEIYGYTPEEIYKAGEELWFNRIHPDDVERVKQVYAKVFDPNEEFNVEYRIKTKDGNWIWLLDWSTQTYEKNGERLAAGVFMDITQRKRMQDILKESEEKAQRYLDIIGSMILTIDNEGIVTNINRMGCEILGYSADEIIGLKWIDNFIPPRLRADLQEVHSKAMSGKITEVEKYENLITTKSGEERLLAWRNVALLDVDGNICGAISSAVDITDRNKAEIKLRNEMEFTETALNSQHDTFFVFEPSTKKAIRWNKAFQQISEYSDEEIASMKALDSFYDGDDLERANDAIQNVMAEGIATLEIRLITKSGKRIPFEYEASLMKVDDNNEFIVSVGRDITDRKYALEEVRKSEARYKALFDSTNDAIFLINLDGIHTEVNEQGARMLGYDREELIGISILENIAPVDREDANEKLTKLLAGESFPVYERTFLKKDGTEMSVEINVALVTDSEGQPHHFQSVARDISERKQAEEALEKQLDFLENVLESLSHPFYVIDAKDYTIKLANKVARIGNLEENPTCHYVTHRSETPCSQSEHPCPLEEVKRTKKPVIVEHKHYDDEGNIRDVEIHAHPIFGDDGNVIQMIEYSLDVTDLKKTIRALEEGEKRFRILYENAPLGYQTLDENGYVVDINSAWLDGTGYQRDEVVGHYFGEFLSEESEQIFEDSFPIFKSNGEISNIEYEMIRKDGSKLIGRFSGRTTNDESGKFKQTACIFQDVTDWKVSDNLLRRQKEELSELAHVMSHDLGNKMMSIRTLITLLKREPNDEVLERIDRLAQQTSELLQSSAELADSGLVVEKSELVDLNQVVQEIASTVIPDNVVFEMDELPKIQGDSPRIAQIVQNLLDNAVEHGHPEIIEVRKVISRTGMTLLVINDGEVIPNDIKDIIFKRGFTTKGQGRGLGLTIVKKLVEAHGWAIDIELTDRTVFKITIPKSSIRG